MTAKQFFSGLFLFILFIFLLDFAGGKILEYGIYKYFGLKEKADYLVIGSSPATLDLDKKMLESATGKKFAFYTQQGATSEDRLLMIRHFLSVNPGKPQAIVYEMTPHIFTCKGLSENSYQLFYPYMSDEIIEQSLQKKNIPFSEYYLRKIFHTSRFSDATLNFAIRGLLGNHTNLKFGEADTQKLKQSVANNNFWKISFDESCIETFRETEAFINEQGIKTYFLFYPVIDVLTDKEASSVAKADSMVKSMVDTNRHEIINYTHFFDGNSRYFYDHLHLNQKGQQVFSQEIIRILR